MINKIITIGLLLLWSTSLIYSGEKIYPGADEKTPSKAQYFSWINNTNEGTTEKQTLVNLAFFKWLKDEYGMKLDIYAFDAGAIDGKRFYGSTDSDRFRKQFPSGFAPLHRAAGNMETRLGIWGGPDGFGNNPEEELKRHEQMVTLCRDYNFALFKFDAVCGALRAEKEDAFIRMMEECRKYSPDLILLNHRLGLDRAKAYATTFLWEGKETYIDVFSTNKVTAPHHRAEAISRGLVPGLMRLTEDHGVCLSSCLDYWDDDLILQAFNRNLILSPQIYGNPWLLRDDEFPKLARIYNLAKKYRKIMVNGIVLPENKYGPAAVSRGNDDTRILTLRNLSWNPVTYRITLDEEIGLQNRANKINVTQKHPVERVLGIMPFGSELNVEVLPFRSCLVIVNSGKSDEPKVIGSDYQVIRDISGETVKIKLLGMPGTSKKIKLSANMDNYLNASLNGKEIPGLLKGKNIKIEFPRKKLKEKYHRFLSDMTLCPVPDDTESLYEATCFAADSNALEVRSIQRSGQSSIKAVQEARKAFFGQEVFRLKGIWDKNLFDGDLQTSFFPSYKYKRDVRIKGGCLRLDLGKISDIDRIVMLVPDEYSLQPLLKNEGNYVDISADLKKWTTLTYLAGVRMKIDIPTDKKIRYLRFREYPRQISEIEGYKGNNKLDRSAWRASNLLAHPAKMKVTQAWRTSVKIDRIFNGSYLAVAVNGEFGIEGAYAALKIGDRLIGAPDRSPSYPSNTWEYIVRQTDRNYTYYFPLKKDWEGKEIAVFILGIGEKEKKINGKVWFTTYPAPYKSKMLELIRR